MLEIQQTTKKTNTTKQTKQNTTKHTQQQNK